MRHHEFIRRQIEQVRAGGLPVLWRKIRALLQRLPGSRHRRVLACYGCKLGVSPKPDWAEAHGKLGDTLLAINRFDEGIACWRKAIALQPQDDFLELSRKQSQDWWSGKRYWNGKPADRYADIYKRSVTLLHRGQWDAMVGLLRMVGEAQAEFARAHQLDLLGIRFLREWTYAIGHIAMLDFYVKMGLLGLRSGYRPIILDASPANRCYLDYWRQYLPAIITDPVGVELLTPLAERLEEHLHVVTFADGRVIQHATARSEVQCRWEAQGRGPLLTLTDLDHERGWRCLESLGVPPGAWFVSLHVRDAGSENGRDADINDYRLAIKSIVARGGWVIRMGDPSMRPMPPMPQVIDYAHSEVRCDWMDVFLWARCRFFIGTQSGPTYVPPTFGVPCVVPNFFPAVLPLPFSQDVAIFKLYWSEAEQRYLTFAEAFASPIGMSESLSHRQSVGIRLVDNTPEEINEVILEMLERLEGTLAYTKEDEELQARFKMLKPNFTEQLGASNGRAGRAFLRKYAHLL